MGRGWICLNINLKKVIDGVISATDAHNLNRVIHYFQKALNRNV